MPGPVIETRDNAKYGIFSQYDLLVNHYIEFKLLVIPIVNPSNEQITSPPEILGYGEIIETINPETNDPIQSLQITPF